MVERGHIPIEDSLVKLTNGGVRNWVFHLPAIL